MEIPNQFVCPITLDLMNDPVTCQDGNTYEREAILEFLKKKQISPLTNQKMDVKFIIPNRALKELIDEFKILREKKVKNNNFETKTNDIDEESLKLINELIQEDENETKNNKNQMDYKNILYQMVIKNIEDIFDNIVISKNISDNFRHLNPNYDLFYNPLLNQNISELDQLVELGICVHKSFYTFAIANRLPKVIMWLREKNCAIGNETMNLAVMIGNEDLVVWLLSNDCSWDIYTFSHALVSNDIKFLSWLLIMECYWGILTDEHGLIIKSNKKIKDWLKLNKCPWNIENL